MADPRGAAETTLPPMPLDAAQFRRLRALGQKVRTATQDRDDAIKEAVGSGGSLREVGEAVGLSHTAVKFIAHGRPAREEEGM